MNGYRTLLLIAALAFLGRAVAGGAGQARAAGPYTVNSTLDEPDALAGNGVCASTPSGVCTLRAAIMEANFHAGHDTIILPASAQPYQLTRAGFDDTALNGDLDINSQLTIVGGGAANTIIDGGDLDRVFHVTTAYAFSISGATIRNGRVSLPGGGGLYSPFQAASVTLDNVVVTANETTFGEGGGIYSGGTLVLLNSVVSDNHADSIDGRGGGIFVPYTYGSTTISHSTISGNSDAGSAGGGGIRNGGTLTLNHSTVSGNTAASAYAAGGIFNSYGVLTLNHSTVSGNQATSQYAYAGGIVNQNGTLNLNQSTVSGNQATHQYTTAAGGIYNYNAQGGAATLTNATVSGNSTHNYGGGIKNDATGVLHLRNATIANNRADSDDSEDWWSSAMGGGISNAGTVYLRNTLIAGNVRGAPGDEDADDCSGTLNSQGYNLLGLTYGCSLADGNGTDKVNLAASLGALALNGGGAQTHLPQPGSPAIDAGNPAGCQGDNNANLASDQRGLARHLDGDGANGARCDIGAVEYAAYSIFVPVVVR